MYLPRLLTDRNPRDKWHRRRALEIIHHLQGGVVVTRKIAREVAKNGVQLPNKKFLAKLTDADAVVCEFFFLEQGVIAPDNIISKCAKCGNPVQLRPHTDMVKIKLCVFCAADLLLNEFWNQQRPMQE